MPPNKFAPGNNLGGTNRSDYAPNRAGQMLIAALHEIYTKDKRKKLTGKELTKLRTIIDKLIACAINGESWAIKEIFDRVDGKALQQINATVDHTVDVSRAAEQFATTLRGIILARKADLGDGAKLIDAEPGGTVQGS